MTAGKMVRALKGGWMPAMVISLLMFGLQGCSSLLPTYQTWQGGSKSRDQVAILHVPNDMRIYSVDGKRISKPGLNLHTLSPRVGLLPGQHQVVFRYYGIWPLKGPARANTDKLPDVVQSPLHQVSFDAQAGGSYKFDFKRPKTENQAKQLAAGGFHPVLENAQGAVVAQAAPYQAPPSGSGQSASSQSVPAPSASANPQAPQSAATSSPMPSASAAQPAAAAPAAPGAGLSTLDALKLLWQKASTEDKKAFLSWAFH